MTPLTAPGMADALAARLHAALPQTQCTRCGFPDCAGYAHAIAEDRADINQCPPGGAEGAARLAAITGRLPQPLNPANGVESPRSVAVIDEGWCIGCTLCIEACPTDAIVGSNKLMHTVIEAYCTGCQLCVPVCPVDCISLENVSGERTGWAAWSGTQAAQALSRYQFHSYRGMLEADNGPERPEASALLLAPGRAAPAGGTHAQEKDLKAAVIQAALARARSKRPPLA